MVSNSVQWEKLGHVFVADNLSSALKTHASNPVALPLTDNEVRVFYSGRDENQRSSIGYVDLHIENDDVRVVSAPPQPVLMPGEIGSFDDSGTSVSCILKVSGKYWLYYLGWNLGVTVPWRNSVGLAMSDDGLRFERVQLAPVLDRNKFDPFSVSYPFVKKEGNSWHMWYGSNLRWGKNQDSMDHVIKYACSKDGIHWTPSDEISVNFKDDGEYAISKPSVVKEGDIYKMWYSYRGARYRIGYAESYDGVHFQRKDHLVGIDVSLSGWDSQSVGYPFVFDLGKHRYMLYNGNHYGLTGFGIARREL